jgi:hypothetical protein
MQSEMMARLVNNEFRKMWGRVEEKFLVYLKGLRRTNLNAHKNGWVLAQD